ncbi:MAG: Nramp family divalent metal transporter, partial [Pirellulales bacterium]
MASESHNTSTASSRDARVKAGLLPDWTVGDLPNPPPRGWHSWIRLVGPGVLLAGASVGSGEWLFGPAVSAQYGGTLLWLAALSIIAQVFCNLEMMRYAVYCGESIIVGYLRTWPGPRFWMVWYALLDLAAIWPFNASNAAVPLAAAVLGHLPGPGSVYVLGFAMPEWQLVKMLGYVIFLLAFVPLVFGGTIYRMLERVMATKLVLVLGFLVLFTVFTVSAANAWEVISGFFRIGTVPLRAETIIVGRHFTLTRHDGPLRLTIKGTIEDEAPLVTAYLVSRGEAAPAQVDKFDRSDDLPATLQGPFQNLTAEAVSLAQPNRFTIADTQEGKRISVVGRIDASHAWHPERFSIASHDGQT